MLVFFVATLQGFGVFRDELYYSACSRQLDWSYVDHPPLVAWVAAAVRVLAGESWMALRVVSALAYGATVFVVGEAAAALGGGRWARVLAQWMAATAPGYLALFSVYSMNPLDVLAWAICTRLAIGVLSADRPSGWIVLGAVVGLGLLNKIELGLFAAGLALGVVLTRRWRVLRARELWLGLLLAAAAFAPHVAWQVAHDWPTAEVIANARELKLVALGPFGFLAAQLELMGPINVFCALGGLAWLLVAPAAAPVRPLALAALVPLATFALTVSKPYYYAPAYTLLFPAAAVAVAELIESRLVRSLLTVATIVQWVAAPLAKPLLSADATAAYQAALGVTPRSDEKQELGRLSQSFADMHGWRTLAEDVAAATAQLPAAEREKVCFFGDNYGQAGAIDYFRAELVLPPAISGHNNYALWGPGRCTGSVLLFLARDSLDAARVFATVEPLRVHQCGDCLPSENNVTIWVGRDLIEPLQTLWPTLRHFD
jgi:hypothetical protein